MLRCHGKEELITHLNRPREDKYSTQWWYLMDSYRYKELEVQLTELDKQARWLAASNLVAALANKYYKTAQKRGDVMPDERQWYDMPYSIEGDIAQSRHHDRILGFTSFLKSAKEDADIWVLINTYKFRFAGIEFLRTQTEAGIAHTPGSRGRVSNDTLSGRDIGEAALLMKKNSVIPDFDNLYCAMLEVASIRNQAFKPSPAWKETKSSQIHRWLAVSSTETRGK